MVGGIYIIMADNYLETRYEQIFEGGSVRKSSLRPSIDLWVQSETEEHTKKGFYNIHSLQVQAVERTIRKAFPNVVFNYVQLEDGSVQVDINSNSAFEAGRIYEILSLKSEEMGLHALLKKENEMGAVIVEIYR